MKFKEGMNLVVSADVNDGDYINQTSPINSQEELNEIIKMVKTIPTTGYNYEDWDDCEAKEQFYDYMPSMDNEEVHTIESIDIEIIEHIASLF